jgi:phage terminase small subunit
MNSKTKVVAPKHLSQEATKIFVDTVTEFSIDDAVGRLQLQTALEALDQMRDAQKIIKRESLTMRDRHGVVRPHPATVILRTARTAMLQAFQALRLEPPKGIK